MDILTFMADNPWQTFFLGPFIIFLGICLLQLSVPIFRLCNRILRTIKVIARGWPPEHIDADGDFKDE